MPKRPADPLRTMPLPKGEWLYSLRFLDALEVAAVMFATTRRKKTKIPYVAHLLGVCAIVLEHGGSEDEAIAALLHDAIEDAPLILVSAADKQHNAGAILSDFREFGDRLWKRFNPDAGKAGVIGYYRGLVTAYKTTGHHPRLVRELDEVITQIERETGHPGVWPLPQ